MYIDRQAPRHSCMCSAPQKAVHVLRVFLSAMHVCHAAHDVSVPSLVLSPVRVRGPCPCEAYPQLTTALMRLST